MKPRRVPGGKGDFVLKFFSPNGGKDYSQGLNPAGFYPWTRNGKIRDPNGVEAGLKGINFYDPVGVAELGVLAFQG
jgi:hypothetical protein